MPAQLSKFSFEAACMDYAHPWTSSCASANVGLGLHSLQESLRIYTTVYIIAFLMKRKMPSREDVKKTILGILQSTAFLSWSGFSYSLFICLLRRMLGRFYMPTVSFLPSFLSSLSSIVIERASRRTLLCLYVSNIATETLFRMGVWRGYISPIPRGEVYIFAVSVAVLLYFYRSKTNKQDQIYKIFRMIVGRYEEAEYHMKKNQHPETSSRGNETDDARNDRSIRRSSARHKFGILWKSFEAYKYIINSLKAQSKDPSCSHPYSCAHYILADSAKIFSYGVCGQIALKLILQFKRLLQKPKLLKSTIFQRENINLAVFLGGFAGLYKLVSCMLRRTFHKDSHIYAIPAGLIASVTFMAYPNSTIALYFMWKALQLLWNNAVENEKLPEVKWFAILLYCFSTALLFHVAILEPQNLRSSYWRFLYNMSGGRIAVMSRIPLNVFGLETSKNLQEVLRKTKTTDQLSFSF
ncbi:transmembrane protein 135 [Solenopsis invicta]|uniref:transmembrane protein 135 n=1 Tax=Solenopsis invicta TaxID=13686 RepID=UPI000595F569|nr:transmembrane protein 135 [Solenopsis invicta]XP_039304094.1 transmembrane protein 135 [Solenopsis invicta]XP_039304095.1 transmembrane protein 135 [Solenopsis invicta]XP_039304096.1 transmembrane protein 135 [Solenopsis invicta]